LLVERTEPIDHLSVEEYWETFGEPETEPVEREDGKPLTSNVPPVATLAWSSEKEATEFTLEDAKRLVISDFGEAFDPSSKTRLGKDSHVPLAKRAPEAFFEPDQPLSYASDVWSLGTAIWGIIGMKNLFSDDEPPNSTVAQQIDLLGADHLPPTWKSIWQRPQSEILAEDRRPHPPEWKREPWPPLDTAFEKFVQKYRREEGYVPFEADETAAILALMRGMLRFDPKERLTIEEALQSEWMVKWALPELQKAMQTDCGQSHE
jgi:serine/threonine protein kinase